MEMKGTALATGAAIIAAVPCSFNHEINAVLGEFECRNQRRYVLDKCITLMSNLRATSTRLLLDCTAWIIDALRLLGD